MTTCYGMNDGSYRAYEEHIGKRYADGMQDIVDQAKALGTTVVVGSPGIVDSVEHDVSGFLTVDPEKGLAAAMVALAINPDLRLKMGHSARTASKEYDISRTVARSLELYNRLRRERPDLKRDQKHGRWYRPESSLKPRLRDLVRKMRLDDDDAHYLDGQRSDE